MAPNKRLRTTRSSQPVEAPTQPNSTGEGPSLQRDTSNDDLGVFSPSEDPAQTLSMPVEINTVGMCDTWLCFFNFLDQSKYIF
jgi:hypothetical protein